MEVLKRRRLEYLKEEGREQLEKTRLAQQDVFHLPGEGLSSTTTVKQEID
jgi:hypothetical protein